MSRGDLPPALDAVVRHCLERNPAERFQSARDLVFNLQAASAATGSGPASAMSTVRSRAKLTGREAIAWTLAAALAMVVIVGLGMLARTVALGAGARGRPFSGGPTGQDVLGVQHGRA